MSSLIITADTDIKEYVDFLVAETKSKTIDISTSGFGCWSPSKVKSMKGCALKFLLKYILKAAYVAPSDPSDPKYADTFLSAIGTAAHFTLECLVQGISFEEAERLTKEKHLHLVTEEQWHRVELLENNMLNFMYRIERFAVENPIRSMSTELKFALDCNWSPVEFNSKEAYYRGVIDLPILLENLDALNVDHKHGGSAKFGIGHHEFQLKSYSLASVTHDSEIRGVTPMIHFIKEGEIARMEYASRDRILNDYTRLMDSAIYGAVDTLKDRGSFKHVRGSYCDYCEFRPICHGGKRGTANALQPIVEASRIFFNQ